MPTPRLPGQCRFVRDKSDTDHSLSMQEAGIYIKNGPDVLSSVEIAVPERFVDMTFIKELDKSAIR